LNGYDAELNDIMNDINKFIYQTINSRKIQFAHFDKNIIHGIIFINKNILFRSVIVN